MAFSNDWEFLRAALPDLQSYILAKELYWPLVSAARIPGSAQIPQLTIGNLAMSRARLAVAASAPGERAELDTINAQIESVKSAWRANWSQKAGHEIESRLNLWQQYLRDLRGDRRQEAGFYASEVRQRAVIALLAAELLDGLTPSVADQLAMLDSILRGLVQPGPFVWENEVAGAFPQEQFWFLYGKPK